MIRPLFLRTHFHWIGMQLVMWEGAGVVDARLVLYGDEIPVSI